MTGTTTASRPLTSTGATTTDKVKETGSDLTHMAQEQVGNAAHQLAERADERRSDLAKTARALEDKLRDFATSVGEEQPKVGEVIEKVSDSAEKLVSYVERTPAERMGQDLSDQMRRHPMLFAAGMFGAGFALSRVLKPVDTSRSFDSNRQLTAPASSMDRGAY